MKVKELRSFLDDLEDDAEVAIRLVDYDLNGRRTTTFARIGSSAIYSSSGLVAITAYGPTYEKRKQSQLKELTRE